MEAAILRRRIFSHALPLVAALLVPTAARAECFLMTAQYVLSSPTIEIVFSGPVVEIARTADVGYRATFDVDTVWKGVVPRRFELYVWELAPEMPRFERGQRYVVSARHLTDRRARDGVGIGASDVVYTPTMCSGSFVPKIEIDLGRGYAPISPAR